MEKRKEDIRKVALDIMFQTETVQYPADKFNHLALGVAEVFERRAQRSARIIQALPQEQELDPSDTKILMEVFWDLVVEKVITIGLDYCNAEFPYFRLHSQMSHLKREEIS